MSLDGRCLTAIALLTKQKLQVHAGTQELSVYIGITTGPFKERYSNNKKSLTNADYANETERWYAWNLKENGSLLPSNLSKRITIPIANRIATLSTLTLDLIIQKLSSNYYPLMRNHLR